jgi:glycosyltransferase involved in cell wall biosynthesis
MTIAFVHPYKSFLPGLSAYQLYFTARGIKTAVYMSADTGLINADVEWHFMGRHTKRKKGVLTIHEYASVSIPPLGPVKDRIKKIINCKPDYRIFGNPYAQEQFGFKDGIPSGIRQTGVYQQDVGNKNRDPEKQYDFIYVGSVSRERKLEKLFFLFTKGPLRERTILVLSKDYDQLQDAYRESPNIRFLGPVKMTDVYGYIRRARYAINFSPDLPVYSRQPASKLLDYAACQVPILSSDNPWVRGFETEFGGSFFYLSPDLSNANWELISRFPYRFPDLSTWTWEKQIAHSGVLELLETRFPGWARELG